MMFQIIRKGIKDSIRAEQAANTALIISGKIKSHWLKLMVKYYVCKIIIRLIIA
ncbi:11955_t:CDS:1, partial [Funneliformis geosporum]